MGVLGGDGDGVEGGRCRVSGTALNLPARQRPATRPDLAPPSGPGRERSAQQAVGDDLEQRAYGGRVEVALVGDGRDAADEPADLDGVDVVAQRAARPRAGR